LWFGFQQFVQPFTRKASASLTKIAHALIDMLETCDTVTRMS